MCVKQGHADNRQSLRLLGKRSRPQEIKGHRGEDTHSKATHGHIIGCQGVEIKAKHHFRAVQVIKIRQV